MWRGRTLAAAMPALLALVASAGALTAAAVAEQASQPSSSIAGTIAAGGHHSCAVLPDQSLRCWGYGGDGALGYGNRLTIGDDEAPAVAGPVDLGPSRAVAVGAGAVHTCALLEDAAVRCWGFGGDGRLGYGNGASIGDDETPGSVQPVELGSGRTATAITAGGAHTCAVLDGGAVRCWGFGLDGRLGYGNADSVGDDETPALVAPVALGAGRSAMAIAAGDSHTCAVLDDGAVRCWGEGANGQLGYGSIKRVGDDETPAAAGPVDLGPGRAAAAISAGGSHTCAVLDDGSVRCWGYGGNGRLGYGNRASVGDTDTPASAGPVDLGPGRTARAVSAGGAHTCALLDDGTVRCWGYGGSGALGYGNRMSIGDDEKPGAVGPVDLGAGRTALAIAAGGEHTCAVLDDRSVRCWGAGAHGRLGHCRPDGVGDDETPGSVGPVELGAPGAGGRGCTQTTQSVPPPGGAAPLPAPGPAPAVAPIPAPPPAQHDAGREAASRAAIVSEAKRAKRLRDCRAAAARRQRSERRAVRVRYRERSARDRVAALRRVDRRAGVRRRACLKRYGRVPGRVTNPAARAISPTKIALTFRTTGSHATRPPAARRYVIKQSRRPIRTARDFKRARALCGGTCRFSATGVGVRITLEVTGLRPRQTYHYAIAARDNVSGRIGARSRTFRATTR